MGEYEEGVVRAPRSANVKGMKETKGRSRKTRNCRKMKKTRDDKMMVW